MTTLAIGLVLNTKIFLGTHVKINLWVLPLLATGTQPEFSATAYVIYFSSLLSTVTLTTTLRIVCEITNDDKYTLPENLYF